MRTLVAVSSVGTKLYTYFCLARLNRPIGIYLVLWPTLWALWIASEGEPALPVLLIFVAGVVLMRSAGCAINDYADRHIDPHIDRTSGRPLATGIIEPWEALMVFAVLTLIAFLLVLQLNRLTILLSIPALISAASYPFTKRYTYLPQAFLGIAFGWAVPMAFAAEGGAVPLDAWLLFFATLFWALAYDTIYAMVDRQDDLKIGVKSTAILFGRFDRLAVALLQAVVVGLLVLTGLSFQLGTIYYIGLAVASTTIIYQLYLIRHQQPQPCFRAFLNNNYFGMVVFIAIALDYWLA